MAAVLIGETVGARFDPGMSNMLGGRVAAVTCQDRAPAPGGRAALPSASPTPAFPTMFSWLSYPDWHYEIISVLEMVYLFPCVIATCSTHSNKGSSQPRPNIAQISVRSVRATQLSSAALHLLSAISDQGPTEQGSVSNGEEDHLSRSW